MKKLIFIMLSLGLFLVSAEARCYIKPQYPGSGPAPKAYCWDVAYVHSNDYYNAGNHNFEYTANKSSTSVNHGGGIYTAIEVFGYGDRTNTDLNYQGMTLYRTENIINQYKILIGKRYYFKEANGRKSNNGTIRTKHYSSVKAQLYVR